MFRQYQLFLLTMLFAVVTITHSSLKADNQVSSLENLSESEIVLMQRCTSFIKNCAHGCLDITKEISFLALFYSSMFTIHEFGHFFVAKLLDPTSNPTIHMFSGMAFGSEYTTPLIDFGVLKIHTDNLFVAATLMQPILDCSKHMAMLAAGPIAGLLSIYLFFVAQACMQKYNETKNIKESLAFGIKYAQSPFENLIENKGLGTVQFLAKFFATNIMINELINQLVYLCTPLIPGSDGQKLWAYFLGHNQNVCTLGSLKKACFDACSQLGCSVSDCINQYTTIPGAGFTIDPNRLSEAENLIKNGVYDCDTKAWMQRISSTNDAVIMISEWCLLIISLVVLYKKQACFSRFMFDQPSIPHAIWNKALVPAGTKMVSVLRETKSLADDIMGKTLNLLNYQPTF